MGLKQKFLILSGLVGGLFAIVSVIGDYMSSTALRESVDSGLRSSVIAKANRIDGWLKTKESFAIATANHMTSLDGDMEPLKAKATLGTTVSDKELLDQAIFTDAYVDNSTGRLIVSAAAPIKAEVKFIGAVCTDISLDTLHEPAAAGHQ